MAQDTKANILHMTRCDYDAIFYRVFCVTLLAIAFTFTLILTNVFIDIDGILNKQVSGKPKPSTVAKNDVIQMDATSEPFSEDFSYDNDDSYRTKRSIETQNFLFHIKNPKIKNMLTNRLSTLLETLDAEESNNIARERVKEVHKEDDKGVTKDVIIVDDKETDAKLKRQKDEDMLHLTMHNILLQGIIGHMDLKEVYKRVNSLMKSLNNVREELKVNHKAEDREELTPQKDENKALTKPSMEDKFVAELIKCNKIQENIMNGVVKNDARKTSLDIPSQIPSANLMDPRALLRSGPEMTRMPLKMPLRSVPELSINPKLGSNVMINTVIDIKSIGSNSSDANTKDNVHGIVELIYNGKSIKFTKPDTDTKQSFQKKPSLNMIQPKLTKTSTTTTQAPVVNFNDLKKIPKDYLNRFVSEYFKRYPKSSKEEEETKDKHENKRIKRNIKIKYDKEENTSHAGKLDAAKLKKKKEDDELYVEIETHFDSKGMKGEKKKKLIRSLIEKIQKAIHSDDSKKQDGVDKPAITTTPTIRKKKRPSLHVRKRFQNPLEHKEPPTTSKYTSPINGIVHRQLHPITIPKTIPVQEGSPNVRDRSGESWKKEYIGPTFLTATKSINSAEMSELDVDYNKVMDVNGIPQRLQKPLNTDMSEESMNSNSFYDLGNMKFFIKDIDGSGFSIGFNQYVDEPPDPETIKLFTGLENVIKTYHQNYDQAQEQATDVNWDYEERPEPPPNMNDHFIVRRSINQKHDYHSNEYKIIYDGHFLPYDNYKDIYERENSNVENIDFRTTKNKQPLIVDENIFEKDLKPAEIFGLANLFQRKKRSLNVKKISNLKGKIKLNRFLNTKAMSTKRIFLNKKRSKRQINKIRIIASDIPHKHSEASDENVFVVSDENMFADRAIVKEVETTELETEKPDDSEYVPYQTEESDTPTYRIFDGKSRHNPLMSKYPHIFMEEISKSREDFTPDNALLFGKIPAFSKLAAQGMGMEKADDKNSPEIGSIAPPLSDLKNPEPTEKIQRVQEIVDALQSPKTNYKVTVKIVPKNMSNGLNSGFKEIHTSINKRFNKNGLMYSSLVNVSEISKVITLNKTKDAEYTKNADVYLAKKIKDQQEKMQTLLRQHQKHIDEQLSRLNEEKTNIESILVDENNTIVPHFDYLDMLMPTKVTHKVLHLSKDDVNKLTAGGLAHKDILPTATPTTVVTVTTTTPKAAPLTVITTPTTVSPIFNDKLKKNIMHTIERNENLTDQILKKIDRNTEILQTFLKKLTDKMDTPKIEHKTPPKEEDKTDKPVHKFEANKFEGNKFDSSKYDPNNFPIDWRHHPDIPFSHNMVIRKNDSHISIPFVYAYQQPILPHKSNTQVASVVYHGHIHTNTIHTKDAASAEKEKVQAIHKVPEANNQTRFFIDELESDYKVIPVNNLKKTKVHKNSTIT